MIDSFDIIFIKMLIKTGRKKILKQILLGLLLSIVFIIIFIVNPSIVKMVIFTYLLLSSFASFLDKNEIFMVYDDFRIFDIDIDSFRVYKAYLIQRIIKDSYITNFIFLVLGTSFLLYKDIYSAIWFILMVGAYVLLSPLNHIVGIKYNNMVLVKVIIDIIISAIVIVGTINNNNLIKTFICEINKDKGLVYILLFILIEFSILFTLSKRETNKVKNYNLTNYHKILKWIKKIDLEVYKDYLLNFQEICINIVNLIALFYIMRDGFNLDSTYLTILFIIVPTGIFTSRIKNKYKIITNDNFFYNLDMEFQDIKYIRKKKLKTILSEVFIKVIISFILLMADKNVSSIMMLIDIIVISTIIAIIHFIIIIGNNRIKSVCMTIIKYILVFLPMIRGYIVIPNYIYFGYLSIVGVLTIYMCKNAMNEWGNNNEKVISNN